MSVGDGVVERDGTELAMAEGVIKVSTQLQVGT